MEPAHIRPFEAADRASCVNILRANTPRFFSRSEQPEFESFIDALPGPYDVAEVDGRVVGCGGWYLSEGGCAGLAWGMVDPQYHRRGIGTELLHHRLAAARTAGATRATVRTTQLTSAFFERAGFVVVTRTADGFGPGLDRLELEFDLA